MCNCIEAGNRKLAAKNTKIAEALVLHSSRMVPIIQTVKVDGLLRPRPVTVLATFCPFCGEKFE